MIVEHIFSIALGFICFFLFPLYRPDQKNYYSISSNKTTIFLIRKHEKRKIYVHECAFIKQDNNNKCYRKNICIHTYNILTIELIPFVIDGWALVKRKSRPFEKQIYYSNKKIFTYDYIGQSLIDELKTMHKRRSLFYDNWSRDRSIVMLS